MKKTIIRNRICKLEICGEDFTPKNSKGAYCCPQHRLMDNRRRRGVRDLLFNLMIKAFKHNYHILFLYKNGAVITSEELKNIGFNFKYIPQMDENDIHWLGCRGLKMNEDFNYKIITIK